MEAQFYKSGHAAFGLQKAPKEHSKRSAKDSEARMSHYLLQFFKYDHLPEKLQEVSRPFCEIAERLASLFPQNAETEMCLRKLLEAKDCAVRAVIYREPV